MKRKYAGLWILGGLLSAIVVTVFISQFQTHTKQQASLSSNLTAPLVVLDGNNRLESFTVTGGQVYVTLQAAPTPGNPVPVNFNGIINAPSNVSSGFTFTSLKGVTDAQGQIELVGLGNDGNVYWISQQSGSWSSASARWEQLILPTTAATPFQGISVLRTSGFNVTNQTYDPFSQINNPNKSVELFVLDNNRAVWYAVSSNWNSWNSMKNP